jgi:hypothetical protein
MQILVRKSAKAQLESLAKLYGSNGKSIEMLLTNTAFVAFLKK